jgi:hypothetical protein
LRRRATEERKKESNKEKNLTRVIKKKSKSKQKTTPKNTKCTMGSLKKEKSSNLEPKPNISNTKQLMQENGPKTWKNTKLRRGLSCCCNCTSQDSDCLNSLSRKLLPNPKQAGTSPFQC